MPKHRSRTIPMKLCGVGAATNTAFRNGALDWSTQTIVNLTMDKLDNYPPFSDLNTNCIYQTKAYRTLRLDRQQNFGTAYVMNSNNIIIDSDIFVWNSEFEKLELFNFSSNSIQQHLQITATHELGHILGLDHQFENEHNSIMDYGQDEYQGLSDYDKEAVNHLYRQ